MILVGELGNKRACQAFSDYLTAQHLPHKVERVELNNQVGFAILVEEAEFEQCHALFSEFINNPNQSKFLEASWNVNQPQQISAFSNVNAQSDLGLAKIWQATGWFTKTITLICISIYIASYFGYFESIFNALSFNLDLSEPYRLITPMLMHLDTLHLVFNLCWWWYLGARIEKSLSVFWLINLTLLSALLSNSAQAIIVGSNFAGLSGVVYALTGFVWLYGRNKPNSEIYLPNNTFIFLLIWMGLGFVEMLPINMANWAHLFGLIAGLVCAQILTMNKR